MLARAVAIGRCPKTFPFSVSVPCRSPGTPLLPFSVSSVFSVAKPLSFPQERFHCRSLCPLCSLWQRCGRSPNHCFVAALGVPAPRLAGKLGGLRWSALSFAAVRFRCRSLCPLCSLWQRHAFAVCRYRGTCPFSVFSVPLWQGRAFTASRYVSVAGCRQHTACALR